MASDFDSHLKTWYEVSLLNRYFLSYKRVAQANEKYKFNNDWHAKRIAIIGWHLLKTGEAEQWGWNGRKAQLFLPAGDLVKYLSVKGG